MPQPNFSRFSHEERIILANRLSNGEKLIKIAATLGRPRCTIYREIARNSKPNNSADYHVIPDTYTKVATYGNTTDAEGGTSSSIKTTYSAYISGAQAADTYIGKVKYTLVHPHTEAPSQPQSCTTSRICYFANVSDYEGTMAEQDIASSVDLLPSNFSRTGYGFAGWSDKYDYATNPEAKFYGPNETITLNTADYTGTNPGLSLYAVWVKSRDNLQDSTKVASVCNSLTPAPINGTANLSSVSALTDQRDNNTYAIARLADGKCWMIENLRLADKDSSNNDIELSATNTNSPSLPLTNNYASSTTSNHLSASTNPTSTAWCTSNSAACFDQSMLYTGNTTERGTNPATDANTYSYGNYYNWYSATAGNGKYANGSGYTDPGDICPAGWTLPTSGSEAWISQCFIQASVALLPTLENTRTTSSTPATSVARRSTLEVATASTGLSLRTVAATRTTCSSTVATSTRPTTAVRASGLASAA